MRATMTASAMNSAELASWPMTDSCAKKGKAAPIDWKGPIVPVPTRMAKRIHLVMGRESRRDQ